MIVAIDAGHGGSDPGAVYNGRQEKDDNLVLAMAVGKLLEQRGIDVVYTRTNDIYETPFKKATDANNAGADYFISFHRNSSETPNNANGVQTLIYSKGGAKERLAQDIQNNLVALDFNDLGVVERPNLVVLKRTKMPAVLIETGFINNDNDNAKFDAEIDDIAKAIADGIIEASGYGESVAANSDVVVTQIDMDVPDDPYTGFYNNVNDMPQDDIEADDQKCNCQNLYRVQVGAFQNRDSADRILGSLLALEFPAFIIYDDGLYKVQVGAYRNLDNAVRMERRLRRFRYNTYITT